MADTEAARERALIERAARGLRAARDYTTRQHRNHGFIFGELLVVPDGLVALAALTARLDAAENVIAAARDLHAEVEMAESVGTCLPDRVPSLRLRGALAAWDAGSKP